ncbi:MAG: chromosome partitioning protein ParB [Sphingomonadales bacterium]|nr:chromosome partitioning protein ParB [Sphingomonadales bacterium]
MLTPDEFESLVGHLRVAGWADGDIGWAENIQPPRDAEAFALETIFVICNSGMRFTVAQKIFDRVKRALQAGNSASDVFGHKAKAAAIDLPAELQPVFEALRNGEIALHVASAYASSSDRERQAEVFEMLKGGYYHANADYIRQQLAEGTYVGSDPKAQLVGRDAYEAAGGRFHGDLFTDAATERWIDGGLLDRLAAEKLAAAAEALREREGFAEVRVLPKSYVGYNDTWELRPIIGDQPALTEEQEARLAIIEAELEEIESASDACDVNTVAEAERRAEQLEAEYDAIQNRMPILSDEQKAGAVAYLVIGPDGTPRLHEQLYLASGDDEDPDDGDEGDQGEDCDGDDARAGDNRPSGKPIYSQQLSSELAEMKSEMLRVHIAGDPQFARDLATFWMADKATRGYGCHDLATELRAETACSPVAGFESETLAAEEWAKRGEALDRSWTEIPGIGERYDAFCALSEEARAAWFGWCIARTVMAIQPGKTGSEFLDHLGLKLGIDVAVWWRPTARNYFGRLSSKAAILGHLAEVGGSELSGRYGGVKKQELAISAERIFAGTVPVEAEIRERALTWVPDVMRFVSPTVLSDQAAGDGTADIGAANDDEGQVGDRNPDGAAAEAA